MWSNCEVESNNDITSCACSLCSLICSIIVVMVTLLFAMAVEKRLKDNEVSNYCVEMLSNLFRRCSNNFCESGWW